MRKFRSTLLLFCFLLAASFMAQSQNILVKYELLSNGKIIENQQLNLLFQDSISSVYYNDETPDRFIDFRNSTIIRTLTTKTDAAKQSTSWSELENPEEVPGLDTILGFVCKRARLSLYSNQIEVWYTDSLGKIGSPYTSVMPNCGMVLKVVRNGNFEIRAISVTKPEEKQPAFPLDKIHEVNEAEFNVLQIRNRYTSIPVFRDELINFGDSIVNPEGSILNKTYRYSKGTVILKKIVLPHFKGGQVFMNVSTHSNGDAYDRTGSVFILTDTSGMLKAMQKGLDQLPVYVVNDSTKYQGIVAEKGYVPPLELMRFFTSFGVGYFNDKTKISGYHWVDSCIYKEEVTELMGDLPKEVWIGVFIGNYDKGGHRVSLSLDVYPGEEISENKSWVFSAFNTLNIMEMSDQNYATLFLYDSLRVTVDIPEKVVNLKLIYTTTGHGGWEHGDEFVPKVNEIFLDDSLIFHQVPWRTDCGTYRLLNPASGNFGNGLSSSDLSRSNWCPGTLTQPYVIHLGNLTPGKHTIKVAIPMGSPEGGSFSAWNVSGILVGVIRND